MTATHMPGVPVVDHGCLISSNPVTGGELGRLPVADASRVAAAVERARPAAEWWGGLAFAERRRRLLRYAAMLANRMEELACLVHDETGKPIADATIEVAGAIDHLAWAARNARRVLRPRRVRGSLLQPEYSALLEYRPYGVVGVIGPWNYPVFTPLGSIGGALASGNGVLFKPSEYTPVVGDWLVTAFEQVVPEHPVLQGVYGAGETGAALCDAGVDKVAFTGSTATAQRVMAACAQTLTPVVLECGGKDAAIVAADADLAAAAEGCVWGGLSNAGQTCVGIELVYVVESVYTEFLSRLVDRARRLTVGPEPDADLGPITMPAQLEIIRRHIEDALIRGARAVLGGAEAVQPPYVHPTILVDVPDDALAVREETFGPTIVVRPVRDVEEALALVNADRYGLAGAVFAGVGGLALARRAATGMTSVNSVLAFTGLPSLPFGGTRSSGFGRVHGDAGLREFAWVKSIARRRFRSPLPVLTFDRAPAALSRVVQLTQLRHGRER